MSLSASKKHRTSSFSASGPKKHIRPGFPNLKSRKRKIVGGTDRIAIKEYSMR